MKHHCVLMFRNNSRVSVDGQLQHIGHGVQVGTKRYFEEILSCPVRFSDTPVSISLQTVRFNY
jgi:hypothetical protein